MQRVLPGLRGSGDADSLLRHHQRRQRRALRALPPRSPTSLPNFHPLGRLAEYRYFNMDKVVADALAASEKILTETARRLGRRRGGTPAHRDPDEGGAFEDHHVRRALLQLGRLHGSCASRRMLALRRGHRDPASWTTAPTKDDTAAIGRRAGRTSTPTSSALSISPTGGHGGAVNTGLAHATGFYFKVVDSDDWLDPAAMFPLMVYLRSQLDAPVATATWWSANYVYDKVDEGEQNGHGLRQRAARGLRVRLGRGGHLPAEPVPAHALGVLPHRDAAQDAP